MLKDEYGDTPGQGGNQWATMESVLPDKDLHVSGTVPGPGGRTTFWLTTPRPRNISPDEWEAVQEAKWERIFGKRQDAGHNLDKPQT